MARAMDKQGLQGKTWAEFKTLEVAVCMTCTHGAIPQNCYNKIKFIDGDWFTKYTTKLNLKLFIKVIKSPSIEVWVLDRQKI
jgi:hypothetical protein